MNSSEASSLSASGTVVLSDLAAKRRKKYTAERDKTKVSLFEHFEIWRDLRKELNLKTDKELAGVLLEIILEKITLQKGTFTLLSVWLIVGYHMLIG